MALSSLPAIDEEDGEIFLSRYHIDPERYAAQGRSFAFMVKERMCKESKAQLGRPVEVRQPVRDPGTKKVRFELRTGTFGEDPVAVIAECCSKTPEFKHPDLPLKEIMSRILLAVGNQPRSVMELYEETLDWVGRADGRVINPEVILRLLASDEYYGFAPAGDPEA